MPFSAQWASSGPPWWPENDATRIAMLFAAMHPERVGHLVLMNPAARRIWAAHYPIGMPPGRSRGSWGGSRRAGEP